MAEKIGHLFSTDCIVTDLRWFPCVNEDLNWFLQKQNSWFDSEKPMIDSDYNPQKPTPTLMHYKLLLSVNFEVVIT